MLLEGLFFYKKFPDKKKALFLQWDGGANWKRKVKLLG